VTGAFAGSTGPAVESMTYAEPGDLAAVRLFVRAAAESRGLPPARVDMIVLAVSELATNTLQHATGTGRIQVWTDDSHMVCEVVDRGAGRSFGLMPAAESHRGRGLAIVAQVVDDVSSYTGPEGTVVRLRMSRDGASTVSRQP
jgi:anti-sigma regulatory factor (Ser/Thr protein kinase)